LRGLWFSSRCVELRVIFGPPACIRQDLVSLLDAVETRCGNVFGSSGSVGVVAFREDAIGSPDDLSIR
jgi:hypothetical protein